ncbi:MAG: hypothetical protein PHW42_02750 [Patescibacteria group bacterium]|nr:hypothetical protein [Patescibacteria group bacterium]MDD4695337.1 hypothetical protein [Patescibacteria group bacterium]
MLVILVLIIGITITTSACKKQEPKEFVTAADTKVTDWVPMDMSVMTNFDPEKATTMWLIKDSYSYFSGSDFRDEEPYRKGEKFQITIKGDKGYFAGMDPDGDVSAEKYFFTENLSSKPSTK